MCSSEPGTVIHLEELRTQGIGVVKLRVQQLMQWNGIRARGKRRFRITTTDSRHGLPAT
jgi:putative transposase